MISIVNYMYQYVNQYIACMSSDDIPSGAHLVCNSLSAAIDKIQAPPLNESIESIWIFGGSSVYEVSPFN